MAFSTTLFLTKFVSEKKICSPENINNLIKTLSQLNLCYQGFQEEPKSFTGDNWKKGFCNVGIPSYESLLVFHILK